MKVSRKIDSSDCYFEPKLSLTAILEFVQDYVCLELKEMGCDNITLREKYNCMWVFTKNRIDVSCLPSWDEEIQIVCKSVKANKLKNFIQTQFFNSNGDLLISSLLECCVIDVDSFSFVKLDAIPFKFTNEDVKVDMAISNISMTLAEELYVKPLMTDYSRHLNNTKTIDEFLNTFDIEEIRSILAQPFNFTIHYTAQARLGEKLSLFKGEAQNEYQYAIKKEDGKDVLRASLKRNI